MELNLFKLGLIDQQIDYSQLVGPTAAPYTEPTYLTPDATGQDVYYLPVDTSPVVYQPLDPMVDISPLSPVPLVDLTYQAPTTDTTATQQPAPIQPGPVSTDTTIQQTGTAQTMDTTQATGPVDSMDSFGYFLDSKGSPLTAHWKWYNVATGETYGEQTSNVFHVWGDTDLENVVLFAEVPGYPKVVIKALDLQQPQNDIVFKHPPYLLYATAIVALVLLARKKNKKVGAITMTEVMPFLYIAGGVLAFGAIQKILVALGILKSPETKNLDNLSEDPNSFWSPNFYLTLLSQGVQWTSGIDTATAAQWIQDIKNAMGFFGDSEATIIGILKRARTQATFSFLAWEYNYETGGDFLAFLRGRDSWYPWAGLSDSDIYSVSQYISKLQKY